MAQTYLVRDGLTATPGALARLSVRTRIARWLRARMTGIERVEVAQALRSEVSGLPQDILRDTGLSAEDASGIAEWQPDLPFFMQNSFGRG